jgi:acyl-coenzyme A thioesterase PaaI-like protein
VTNESRTIPDAEPLAAASDLAAALRELIEVSVTTTVGAGEVRAAAQVVREVAERLAVARRPVEQVSELVDLASGRRVFNPVNGVASALAPPLRLRREEDGLVGEATLGVAYEGPPSFVHGGMSALLMDQVLGDTAAEAGVWGMTAHLELDYRGPLPLGEPLVLRGRAGESDGRKSLIVGTIARAASPEDVLVEARGLFVTPRREKLEAYFGGITDATGARRTPARAGDATAVPEDRPS